MLKTMRDALRAARLLGESYALLAKLARYEDIPHRDEIVGLTARIQAYLDDE